MGASGLAHKPDVPNTASGEDCGAQWQAPLEGGKAVNLTFDEVARRVAAAGVSRSVRQLRRDFARLRVRANALPRRPLIYTPEALARLRISLALPEDVFGPRPARLLTVQQAKRKATR